MISYEKLAKELGNFRNIQSMQSSTGNSVPNQFIIYFDKGSIFWSYNTPIVLSLMGQDYLNYSSWDYSATTGKYRNKYLQVESKRETEKLLKSGSLKFFKYD